MSATALQRPRIPTVVTQLVRFGLVGATNTGLTLAVYSALVAFVGAPVAVAAAVGWGVGAVNGFVLNRAWTFRASPGTQLTHLPGLPLGTRGGILAKVDLPSDGEYVINIADMVANIWGSGLESYSAHEVKNSPWITELVEVDRAHERFDESQWTGRRHFMLTFHDETLECVAKWTITRIAPGATMAEVLARLSAEAL